MKTVNQKLSMFIIGIAICMAGMLASCSKSSSNTPPPGPKPPTNPGGYDSSNQIQSSALVAYWGFNGNFTESKQNLTGTNSGATFTTGVKGQAYQGSGSSYVYFSNVGTALPSLNSYTLSVWIKVPAQPINDTTPAYISGQGTNGIFFLFDNFGNQSLLQAELEPYTTTSDSLRIHSGFSNTSSTGYQGIIPEAFLDTAINKWTHVVTTYNGASSTYTIYQNGVAIGSNSAWTNGMYLSPNLIYNNAFPGSGTPMGNIVFKNPPIGMVLGGWPYEINPSIPSIGGPRAYAGSLQGAMDELRIYSVALNATDVNSLYLLEKAGF